MSSTACGRGSRITASLVALTLKVKYSDFRQITRSKSGDQYLTEKNRFADFARELLAQVLPAPLGVRLMGLTLSALINLETLRESKPVSPVLSTQHAFDF